MSFINRVSVFFLAGLAIALLGFSATLYLIVRNHLYGQFESRLGNALRILSAAVEVELDDAKWQPAEFSIDLAESEGITWFVTNEQGQLLDHSSSFSRQDSDELALFKFAANNHRDPMLDQMIGPWRVLQKQLAARSPKPASSREADEHASIRITVAKSTVPVHRQLRKLVIVLVILPTSVWCIAAVSGRWYIRHALSPLRQMATRARSMNGADFNLRLPVSATPDELAELGLTVNKLLDELQQAFEREHRFAGNAAHQLRTPLTVFQGHIDVALRRERSISEYQKTLGVLKEQVLELRQMVESLLFLARATNGTVAPDLSQLDLTPWLVEFIRRWDHHPRCGDISLVTGERVLAFTSSVLLRQLVASLIENALKYSCAGTPIRISAMEDNGQILLAVEDEGIGIEPADRRQIFEPFFRSKSARLMGTTGTGLGLSIVIRIASALNATLQVDSSVGQGSTFRVYLPIPNRDRPSTIKTERAPEV